MAFNLEDYEDVASLNRWFQDNYPMGRIAVDVVSDDSKIERIVVLASVYRDINDAYPAVQNLARGKQEEYNRNMARFYAEDVATSAIGRAILILKGAEKTAHKEGVARAIETKYNPEPNKFEKKVENFTKEKIQVEKPSDPWTIEQKEMPLPVAEAITALNDGIVPEEIPMCKEHGKPMVSRTGNTRGKNWKHYKCSQFPACKEIIWYEINKSGQWVAQQPRTPQTEVL